MSDSAVVVAALERDPEALRLVVELAELFARRNRELRGKASQRHRVR